MTLGILIYASHPADAQTQPASLEAANTPAPPPSTAALEQPQQTWLTQSTMTGDWGGLRTSLSQAGYDFRSAYIGEYAYNFSGGKRIGGDYAQQFAIGMDVDMGKVADLTGGSFHVTFNVREGRNTTADFIGNKIDVQEIYGDGENFRLAELSWDQFLFDKTLDLRGGFVIMGNDFGGTPILCDFENDAFCAHANSLPTNSGWSDYPAGKWGGRARLLLPDDLYAEIGVYEVNPTYSEHDNGFKVSLQGSTGAIIPIEFGKTIKLGPAALPGHYKIGGYYDSSFAADITDTSVDYKGRYGGYLLMDQMVWRFEPGTDRGLIVVVDATVSDIRTAQIPTYYVGALILQGAFAARPNDFIALGYTRDSVNINLLHKETLTLQAQGIQDPGLELGENIVELGYGFQATPWMLLHPNVQYIGNPGAFSFKHVPDAWVFGFQTKLVF
jgi:porin